MIGTSKCVLQSVSDTLLVCITGLNAAGSYPIVVQVIPNGYANINIMFKYNLIVSSISPNEGYLLLAHLKNSLLISIIIFR